jgi:lipid II:glycine glycyltransferase (peptidoglycan interpeptide bridge formation enzyme)
MQVNHIIANQSEEWNSFAAQEPSFALLQSWEWGEFKEKMGWKVFRIAIQKQSQIIAGAQMLIKPLPSELVSIAYIPRGPIGNWLDKQIASQLFSELHRVARLHRAIFLKVEPPLVYNLKIDQTLQQYHFRPSYSSNQPRATIILNLHQSMDDIWLQLRKTTKQCIKSSAEKGVSIRVGGYEDLSSFYKLMKITSKRAHFSSRTRAYYEQEWQSFANNKQNVLLLAIYQDQLLAAHMTYRFGDHAAYFHSGSIIDSAKLHPNHLLVWEAIKLAKEQGCRTYDLWGIPEEIGRIVSEGKALPASDRTDGLWGVYQFKSGYSKNVVNYLGAYDYVYRPLLYKMFTNRLINMEALDRFSAMVDLFARA